MWAPRVDGHELGAIGSTASVHAGRRLEAVALSRLSCVGIGPHTDGTCAERSYIRRTYCGLPVGRSYVPYTCCKPLKHARNTASFRAVVHRIPGSGMSLDSSKSRPRSASVMTCGRADARASVGSVARGVGGLRTLVSRGEVDSQQFQDVIGHLFRWAVAQLCREPRAAAFE